MKRFFHIKDWHFRFARLRCALWGVIVAFLFAIAAALFFQIKDVVTKPVGWERDFRLSDYDVVTRNLKVATRGNLVAVTYEGRTGGTWGVYASVSFNGGETFLPSIKIADTASPVATNPHIAISGTGQITAMWHVFDEEKSGNRIVYSVSQDMGATWSESARLELEYDTTMLPRAYYDDKGRLHLFYHAGKGDVISLYHAVSADGVTFKTTGRIVRISRTMRGAFFPAIHLAGDRFYIVWQGKEADYSDELFFMRSTNYGRSWSSKLQITSTEGNNASPSLVMHKEVLYLAFQNSDDKNWSIDMIRGFNGGRDWETGAARVSITKANCYAPQIASTGDSILIVWYDMRDGRNRIYSRKYSLVDRSFEEEKRLSLGAAGAKDPSLVTVGKRAIVFWDERNMIMAKYSDLHVDPPRVYSETHPPDTWSRVPVARIKWAPPDDESGITGYATFVNDLPDFNPTVQNERATVTEKVYPNIDDGVSYFHIRAIDGSNNFSRTVHYRLQVSANPLSMPVVVSPTHPQGKSVQSNSPLFRWAVDDTERLKGFMYGFSREEAAPPREFTRNFEINFSDLEEGNYFFTLAALDKTNQMSRVAVYNIAVGQAKRVDPEYLKRLAEEDEKLRQKRKKIFAVKGPYVYIDFPFDPSVPYAKESFDALVITRNIDRDQIEGYQVFVDRKRQSFTRRVNTTRSIITARDLKEGEYYVGVRGKYYKMVEGEKQYFWTRPYVKKITVRLPAYRYPLDVYTARIMEKLTTRSVFLMILTLSLTVVTAVIGYGTRLSFYLRNWKRKIRLILR